jgi:IS4 transposase
VIKLTSPKATKNDIDNIEFRLVHVFKQYENKVIQIITNELDWTSRTIADLNKKRWDIEYFF